MGRGRKRKPVGLKLVDGSFREDRDGRLEDQVIATGEPSPVRELSGAAREFWGRVVPRLLQMGVASAADSDTLTEMAECHGLLRKAHEIAELMPTDRDARISYLGYLAQWDKLAAKFGLSPADRAKLKVEKPQADDLEQKYG